MSNTRNRIRLKATLDWEAITAVMVKHWRAAGQRAMVSANLNTLLRDVVQQDKAARQTQN